MSKQPSVINRLKNLQGRAKVDFALELLAKKQNVQITQDALRVLADATPSNADGETRATLLRYYQHYAEQGTIRDPGTYTRALIAQCPARGPDALCTGGGNL